MGTTKWPIVAGMALLLTLSACRAQSPESVASVPENAQQEQQMTAETPVGNETNQTDVGPAGEPNGVAPAEPRPSQPPPATPGNKAQPRPQPVPSPWQPPAEVDPVRPEVGNETPGA